MMNRRNFLAGALACLSFPRAAFAEAVTLADLMKDKKKYDGQEVTVTATVKSYYEKADFSSFLLFDKPIAISVYAGGMKGFSNEQRVTVTGTFYVQKRLGNRIMSNVVEAKSVTPA